MQSVSKEMFNGSSGREMLDESLARVENSPELSPEDRKALRDVLSGARELNERRAGTGQGALSGGLTIPFQTRDEAITSGGNVAYNGYAHSFGGMGIQFILFMGLDVGITLLMLRRTGLWQRLRAAPLSRTTLLGSRTVSASLTAGFILAVLFTFARLVFGAVSYTHLDVYKRQPSGSATHLILIRAFQDETFILRPRVTIKVFSWHLPQP